KNNRITRMRIYGPDPDTLRALGGTNIELILDVPNNQLESLSGGAKNWQKQPHNPDANLWS
ncbi:hypothetical protein EXU34_22680, partial [Alteromonas sp. ZYF713]|nr:hypothetical protein [Alteromonas sp. ZYF713]